MMISNIPNIIFSYLDERNNEFVNMKCFKKYMDTNKCWIAKGEKQELQSPLDGYLKSCTAEMLRCSPVVNFSNELQERALQYMEEETCISKGNHSITKQIAIIDL